MLPASAGGSVHPLDRRSPNPRMAQSGLPPQRTCESLENSLYEGPPNPSNPDHFQLLDGLGGPSYTLIHKLRAPLDGRVVQAAGDAPSLPRGHRLPRAKTTKRLVRGKPVTRWLSPVGSPPVACWWPPSLGPP